MKKCEKCGKYLEDSATFCSFCGNRCGTYIDEDTKNKKKSKKDHSTNYLAIFSFILSLFPMLFAYIIALAVSPNERFSELLEGRLGEILGIIYFASIILAIIISFISLFKRGGKIFSILGLVVSLLTLAILLINMKDSDLSFIEYLKTYTGLYLTMKLIGF